MPSYLAAIRVSHNSCTIVVRDEHACGGTSRNAIAQALRLAADIVEFADDWDLGTVVDGNVVRILAMADWVPREFGHAILEVAEHCNWRDRHVMLIGDVREDIGVSLALPGGAQ